MKTTMVADVPEDVRDPVRAARPRSFERWGVVTYLVVLTAVVAAILIWLGGRLIYVLDDPAIHLSVADELVRHGTWGVEAGHFESASSSPLWTLLVAAGLLVTPAAAEEWVPLVLNAAAGLAVIVVLGRSQVVLQPGRRRPLDAVATVILVAVALFLPGLTVVAMEHTLHVLLVLAAVVLVQRQVAGGTGAAWGPAWLPYLLIVLGTLTRFETAFVAVGLAAGLALGDTTGGIAGLRARISARHRQIAGLLAAAGLPIIAFAVVNRALGGGLLPNSVLAKGQATGGAGRGRGAGLVPSDVVDRLTGDPLLAGLVGVAVAYLVVTWGRRSSDSGPDGGLRGGLRLIAVTLVVAAGLHVVLADIGWFERYQAYLVTLGVVLVLGILAELPEDARRRGLVIAVVLVPIFGMAKITHTVQAPRAADDMYRQQFQAARFFARYYEGEPVATDQLGYISLLHDGPITDFAGLGDYEALQHQSSDPDARIALRQRLAEERGFEVAALYDMTALFRVPEDWVLAGSLHIDSTPVMSVSRDLEIWSTTSDEEAVEALLDQLAEFEPELPDRVSLEINELAGFQAAAARREAGP